MKEDFENYTDPILEEGTLKQLGITFRQMPYNLV